MGSFGRIWGLIKCTLLRDGWGAVQPWSALGCLAAVVWGILVPRRLVVQGMMGAEWRGGVLCKGFCCAVLHCIIVISSMMHDGCSVCWCWGMSWAMLCPV